MGIENTDLSKRILDFMCDFVAVRTDTNTKYEKDIEDFFECKFGLIEENRKKCHLADENMPRFHFGFHEISGDIHDRRIPWALVEGEGDDTVILVHHSDTVDSTAYKIEGLIKLTKGKAKEVEAFEKLVRNPEKLKDKLRKLLGSQVCIGELESARGDLSNENWIFGRGVADMKGGGAIHMALLEEYAIEKGFKGNVLLLSLVDEENLSEGMRATNKLLKDLRAMLKKEFNYVLTINAESHEREDDGIAIIHDGSIGKIMPVVYVQGAEAHTGMIYKGLNPVNVLAEIIRRTELSPFFIEKLGNTVSPPPTWLYHKDCKKVYNATTPHASLGYMSLLPMHKTPKQIMESLRGIAEKAFYDVICDVEYSYFKWETKGGSPSEKVSWEPKVMMFSDLLMETAAKEKEKPNSTFCKDFETKVTEVCGEVFGGRRGRVEEAVKLINDAIGKEMETRSGEDQKIIDDAKKLFENAMAQISDYGTIDGAKDLIEFVLKRYNGNSPEPVVVLALSPPYYPAVSNSFLKDDTGKISDLLKKVSEDMRSLDEPYFIQIKNVYTGISDLSYSMFPSSKDVKEFLIKNILMWANAENSRGYSIPLDDDNELTTPVLNIGPWGKNIHKLTERVYEPDLCKNTPRLTDYVIRRMLGHQV